MKVLGKIIICMVKVSILGATVENMKANTIWIRNMAMEFTSGLMEGGMKDTGKMESNTEKESI